MLEFSTFRNPTALKPHICDLCGESITAGEKYIRFSGKYDGYMFDTKLHTFCSNVIDRYCKHVGENEYGADEVIDWIREVACSGCKYWEDDNDDPPCNKSIFTCERIRNYFEANKEAEAALEGLGDSRAGARR